MDFDLGLKVKLIRNKYLFSEGIYHDETRGEQKYPHENRVKTCNFSCCFIGR